MSRTKKVILGMSGGVDSSVAAHLLIQQGYQVEGLFMKNWEEDDDEGYCHASEDVKDAESIAKQLGIPFHTINFATEYWDHVFEYFLSEYQQGRTPNPDILCNREIKFKAFLDYALTLGADYIATGHYAAKKEHEGQYFLCKANDLNKDQSYFLHALNQQQLRYALFPLATIAKPEIRAIAENQGFINAGKKDSTGICFIGERKFKTFLQRYLPAQPGEIWSEDGECIGEHDGLMYYTIGQRQGLHIGGLAGRGEAPWYVIEKDLPQNRLVVAQGAEHPKLYQIQLHAVQSHWISGQPPRQYFECMAKIRYRQNDQACSVSIDSTDLCRVQFSQPQRAVTPGQSIVFYQGNVCLGGAVIQ